MKKVTRLSVLGAALSVLSGCSGASGGVYSGTGGKDNGSPDTIPYEDSGYFTDSSSEEEGKSFDDPSLDDEPGTIDDIKVEDKKEDAQITAGQLTAKALFDNDPYYYEYFCSTLSKDEQFVGQFARFQNKFNLDYKRVKVTVKNVPYAKVKLLDVQGNELWSTVADVNGECYLFSNKDGNKVSVTVGDETKLYDANKNVLVEDFENSTLKYNKIQVLFNIDTTGSMGDEIAYLKAELKDVMTRIKSQTNAETEVGIIVYRDKNDVFLTDKFDFSTSVDSALSYLDNQFAAGGGDFEEAVEKAYEVARQFTWANDATKIIVHVADAPSHDGDVSNWFDSVKYFSQMGAHILTVASSGIDSKTEYLFRMQSLQTNGCYAFLTDDSGIGDSHKEAITLDDLPVEHLNDLLVRVIKGFHDGDFQRAVNEDLAGYPELLYFNSKIHVNKDVQSVLVKKYIEQFAENKNGAKAGIKMLFLFNNIPFVYIEDNFVEAEEIETTETFGDYTFTYKDNKRKIMMFNGSYYITLSEALEDDLAPFSVVPKLYNLFETEGNLIID